jgi:hypothetical protein
VTSVIILANRGMAVTRTSVVAFGETLVYQAANFPGRPLGAVIGGW